MNIHNLLDVDVGCLGGGTGVGCLYICETCLEKMPGLVPFLFRIWISSKHQRVCGHRAGMDERSRRPRRAPLPLLYHQPSPTKANTNITTAPKPKPRQQQPRPSPIPPTRPRLHPSPLTPAHLFASSWAARRCCTEASSLAMFHCRTTRISSIDGSLSLSDTHT